MTARDVRTVVRIKFLNVVKHHRRLSNSKKSRRSDDRSCGKHDVRKNVPSDTGDGVNENHTAGSDPKAWTLHTRHTVLRTSKLGRQWVLAPMRQNSQFFGFRTGLMAMIWKNMILFA